MRNKKPKITQHLLENKYSLGLTENIVDLIHTTNEGKMLKTFEIFYMHKETSIHNQINDKCTVSTKHVTPMY